MTESGEILAYTTATGHLLWAVSPSASYFATAAALSPDGSKIFITGDGQTAAYDAGTGALLWSQQYGSGSAGAPLVNGTSLAVSPDGSTVYVAGTSNHVRHGGIVAYASTSGTIEWTKVVRRIFGGSATAKVPAVAVAPGGATLFVIGGSRDGRGNDDMVTQARAASTGTELWSRHYESTVPESETGPANIAVSPNGSAVFVTGASSTPEEDFNTTLAYKADTGATLWKQGVGGAAATVVSPDGSKVVVCGTEQFGTQQEFVTTAFRS
jgi:DNA-binding beta-propeller fold protein YncE